MSRGTRLLSCLLACWLLTTAVGCATMHWPLLGKPARKATARNPATQMVCLWECAEGRDAKGIPCQGFAGQILFLANGGVLPVSVDGDVRIYLFDNKGTIEEQAEPIHILNFDSGSWAKAYTYGALGPSYSVFVPYTRKDVTNAMCSLRIRLAPKKGPVIFSDMTSIELVTFKGSKSAKEIGKQIADPRVEQTIPMDLVANSKLRKTTTIQMHPEGDPRNGPPNLLPVGNVDNAIQLAGYEVDSSNQSSSDARIAQLEQMVRELRDQQARSKQPPVPSETAAPPQRLRDQGEKPARIRIRPTEAPTIDAAPSYDESSVDARWNTGHRHPLELDSEAAPRTVRRQHHLEDDDAPRRTRPLGKTVSSNVDSKSMPNAPLSTRSNAHPLLQVEEDERPEQSISKSVSRRHPLFDDADDEPRRAVNSTKKTSTKIIPASNPWPTTERDPFEPIDPESGDFKAEVRHPLER